MWLFYFLWHVNSYTSLKCFEGITESIQQFFQLQFFSHFWLKCEELVSTWTIFQGWMCKLFGDHSGMLSGTFNLQTSWIMDIHTGAFIQALSVWPCAFVQVQWDGKSWLAGHVGAFMQVQSVQPCAFAEDSDLRTNFWNWTSAFVYSAPHNAYNAHIDDMFS